jgi:hypothetical protein
LQVGFTHTGAAKSVGDGQQSREKMQKKSFGLKFSQLLVGALYVSAFIMPTSARAHVKWFAPYNVAQAPVGLSGVFDPTFIALLVLTLVVLWLLCVIERTAVGDALLASVEEVFVLVRDRIDMILRAGTGAFFVAIWAHGGIILTPELLTTSAATEWLQLAIAMGLLFRTTMLFSAFGIVILFAQGIWSYGLFHMMDYPIFLGAAVYMAMSGLGWPLLLGLRRLDIVRIGAAVTLLWASIEKWAYPEWTYPVLYAHQRLSLGLDPRFYMTAAGMVEFGLAFSLLWTPLVRRMAAVVLLSMFVSAVFEFGKIDAIGHAVIVVILLSIAADDGVSPSRSPVLAPIWLSVALAVTFCLYYGGHALIFGTGIV